MDRNPDTNMRSQAIGAFSCYVMDTVLDLLSHPGDIQFVSCP